MVGGLYKSGGPTLETDDKQEGIIGGLVSLLTNVLVGCKIEVLEGVSGRVGAPCCQLVVVEERRPQGLLRLILLLPCMVRTVKLST